MMAEDKCPTIMNPNWLELPRDITENILSRLDTFDFVTSVCLVCPLWWNIFKDPLMWRVIRVSYFEESSHCEMIEICRYAVKRSCHHLEVFEFDYFFCDEDLLKYLADCTHLRRMRLATCEELFIEAVKKLPLLEELEIAIAAHSNKYFFELIGRHCPRLKSLQFYDPFPPLSDFDEDDDDAFSIAKAMPKLRNLVIRGNPLTNSGLSAIMNGCPFLESLLLREWTDEKLLLNLPKKLSHYPGHVFLNSLVEFC